jgi:hypothetical protein
MAASAISCLCRQHHHQPSATQLHQLLLLRLQRVV